MTERIPTRNIPIEASGNIHTRRFTGFYRNLRLYGAGVLMLFFFGTAWLNWQGRQAVLWDLADRKFYIFGATIWPQDLFLLAALLMIGAFGLFTLSVFAGRVWCGYACPQSVWTWMFMWVEQITEGDRNQRIKLDAQPWSAAKLARRSAKHSLWLCISLATGLTFIGYFTPIRPLVSQLLHLTLDLETAAWVGFFGLCTYMNAGWLREKVCRDMCPYSNLQSVMFDADTLIITYDTTRGESRGARRKDEDPKALGLGDCIDCTLCVQVCPTGIDIRDGLQLECISCGACIDACDSVMDKMGYERGLVRYSSEREMTVGKTHWLRPKMVAQVALLSLLSIGFVVAFLNRPLVALDVYKDRGLYRENSEGQIENIYSLKVINKTQSPHRYAVSLHDDDGRFALQGARDLELQPGEIQVLPVSVVLLGKLEHGSSTSLRFEVRDLEDDDIRITTKSRFVAPAGSL
ncbi:MAG: cytochrome c oxidase accessory protein CcoG [Fluviicoccus sp.]|uniref:cytochrome c oxidase accessory protein CcoG n=1 Tax=Fluviicoccus sp. TaxID=2003552 RepID=UPI0027194591|nr:cytochrome c oxidase accessory protein CcoG [Fluviicoccus sp.]MDO8328892.1 cytochrome c oxidase accessory protein CcoG [Fluviicoccus sp.]